MEKFIVTPKEYKKDDRYVTMTIRIERTLQEAYDDLSTKTNRSRNELMGMALRYAIDNMELKDSE
ncbi:MAG: CopG family transcriptional regulator [Anaerotignum sp.]|jgi:predicted transcriptional regulator|nr:CopG family transcriptional regulator [Anaerotignum sp.]